MTNHSCYAFIPRLPPLLPRQVLLQSVHRQDVQVRPRRKRGQRLRGWHQLREQQQQKYWSVDEGYEIGTKSVSAMIYDFFVERNLFSLFVGERECTKRLKSCCPPYICHAKTHTPSTRITGTEKKCSNAQSFATCSLSHTQNWRNQKKLFGTAWKKRDRTAHMGRTDRTFHARSGSGGFSIIIRPSHAHTYRSGLPCRSGPSYKTFWRIFFHYYYLF